MQHVFDIYEAINFITDKVRNGYCTTEETAIALGLGQQSLFDECLPKMGMDEIATNALQGFIKTVQVTSNPSGLLALPNDFATMPDSALIDDLYRSFTAMNSNEVRKAVSSVLYPIEDYPRYLKTDNALQLFPKVLTTGELRYVKKPVDPKIGYTISGNDIVYNPSTSVQIGFGSQYYLRVIIKALPFLGVNLSDGDVVGLAAQYESSNQPI